MAVRLSEAFGASAGSWLRQKPLLPRGSFRSGKPLRHPKASPVELGDRAKAEARVLEAKFGEEYCRYRSSTWFQGAAGMQGDLSG